MGHHAGSVKTDKNEELKSGFGANTLIKYMLEYGIYVALVLMIVILGIISPNFLTLSNAKNVLQQISVNGLLAIGMTFVIIVRGIDVSAGSIVALSSCVSAILMTSQNVNPVLGIVMMIIIAMVASGINGFGSSYLMMPAFIVTLAMTNVARGLALSLSGGKAIYGLPKIFSTIGNSSFLNIPIPIWIFLGCALIAHIILSKTVFGKQIYAVGGNPDAARVSGINVERVILGAFLLSGFFVGMAAFTVTARMNSYFPNVGVGYEFDAIASVVIGGTSLFGGVGWIGGTIVGVLIMGIINNALNLLNVSAFYQLVAKGLIIFLAVLIDTLKIRNFTRKN
ncbi:MAG: ABC transporter permease [Bacillota bacterium]